MTKKQKIIYIYLMLLPILDTITSLTTRYYNLTISPGMIIKGLTLSISIIYIFIFSKSKWRKISIKYFIILSIYFTIYTLSKNEIWITNNYITEITYAFKYFFFIVMLFGILNIFDDFKIDLKYIKKIFLLSSIIYTALLLIPFITNTNFYSYNSESIGGSSGWFYAANETGAITVLLLLGTSYLLNNEKKYNILVFVPILLSIALIGTKVSYIGMIIAILTIIIFNLIIKKKDGIILSALLLIALITICNLSPATSNLKKTNEKIEKNNITSKNSNQLNNKINNKFIAKAIMLGLNGREDFFLEDLNLYNEANSTIKLFGLGWSYCNNNECDFDNLLVEIDYIDIIFHYGIIGFTIYFIPLIYILLHFFKQRKSVESYYYYIFLILALLISSIAGHVLSAPAVSIYVILIIYMLYDSYLYKINEQEITIMSLHLGHGGIEKYIQELCSMLENDYKINIITTYKLYDKPVFNFSNKIQITYLINEGPNKNIFIKYLKEKDIKNILKEGIKSIKILYLKNKRNIKAIKNIHSKYIITTRDFHNKLVGDYANKNIIKIATEHNFHNNNKKYYNRVINSVRNFDYFILVSNNLKEFYENKVKGPKCIYIPNTINDLPKEGSKLKENNLISIGRIEKEKGFDDLIDVVRIVKKDIKDIKLYLIGDGSLKKQLEIKTKENNLEDTIIFTGYGNRELIAKYLLKSKLYVMTSHTESFGIVLLEAMSYKVPCIAFDSADGPNELLKNNVGILIKNRNKEEMAKEIIYLLNNKNKLKQYQEKGYQKCQYYLNKNVKKEWIKLLKQGE